MRKTRNLVSSEASVQIRPTSFLLHSFCDTFHFVLLQKSESGFLLSTCCFFFEFVIGTSQAMKFMQRSIGDTAEQQQHITDIRSRKARPAQPPHKPQLRDLHLIRISQIDHQLCTSGAAGSARNRTTQLGRARPQASRQPASVNKSSSELAQILCPAKKKPTSYPGTHHGRHYTARCLLMRSRSNVSTLFRRVHLVSSLCPCPRVLFPTGLTSLSPTRGL